MARSHWARLAVAAMVLAAATDIATQARADSGPPPFSATAAAEGVHVLIAVPGGPVTDTPVDSGGPTAQVSLDSLGNSAGYAAFPDPGPLVISAPGLLTGLLSGGAGGLPPIALPTLPNYPLFVASDPALHPDSSAGSGPYALHATSTTQSSTAEGTAGLEASGAGNTALVKSSASATSTADSVTATATSDVQGVTVGPLTLGEIRSTAALAMSADGTTTPRSTIEISGVRVGGVAIDITPQGLYLGGPVVPLPLTPVLNALLAASGFKVEIAPGTTLSDGVTAPSVRISRTFDAKSVGKGQGTMTVVLGESAVHLGSPSPLASPPVVSNPITGGTSNAGSGAAPLAPLPASRSTTAVPSATTASSTTNDGNGTRVAPPTELVSHLSFDIRSLYLTVAVLAGFALLLSQFIRRFGVRAPWT